MSCFNRLIVFPFTNTGQLVGTGHLTNLILDAVSECNASVLERRMKRMPLDCLAPSSALTLEFLVS